MHTATAPAPAPVLLISTDFDGTLVEHGNPTPFAPLLMEILRSLRGQNVRWAINTGRTLPSLQEGLESFAMSVRPDFALTSERDVYRPTANGRDWEDFGDWNLRCARAHRELFDENRAVFEEMARHLKSQHRRDAALRQLSAWRHRREAGAGGVGHRHGP